MYSHFRLFLRSKKYADTGWYDNSRAKLFALFLFFEMCIHLAWYVLVSFLTFPKLSHTATTLQYTELVNYNLVAKMGGVAVGMMLFAVVSIFAFARLKGGLMLAYQTLFLCVYLCYSTFFALYLGENTLINGINFLGSVVLGLLLFYRRLVLLFFVVSTLSFVVATLNRKLQWWHFDSFYVTDAAYSYWFWIISGLYLALPKSLITIYVVYQMLDMVESQQQTIQKLSQVDALTGAYNRRSIYYFFDYVWRRRDEWQSLSLIYLDMDKFKFINDTFGHDVGDTVLIKVTESILAVTGNQFPLSRLGGEEFVVVLTDVPQATATVWAEKIRQKIAQIAVRVPFEQDVENNNAVNHAKNTHVFYPTASLGVATLIKAKINPRILETNLPEDSVSRTLLAQFPSYLNTSLSQMPMLPSDIQKLMYTADTAMLEAKTKGRNQVVTSASHCLSNSA